ncbi:GNAT family N-acetyltransferase [Leptolyngbya sp. NK1-12]|uniref:GNAT family N-acetyltransferase n=1 Tax=Leptolyngbya sp. NK1-12 TaxID=2547451 RepID=A0AA97AFS3_9CYAN|nr:GNAT family N-acetyltransferase [Leptolyngbya sp. NK1-12]WNZ23490.1 GNAT family N-acetyltransferase [Leptolyngbya sp. NK1-12]
MRINIRPAEITDAAAIFGILQALEWFPHLKSDAAAASEQMVCHLNACLADNSHSVYVAEQIGEQDTEQADTKIVGYAAVHWLPYLLLPAPEGFISELFVDQNHRGEGIGSLLLAAIQAEAKARGCSRLMLVNSRERESYQRQFYQKQGWIERENIANFIYKL